MLQTVRERTRFAPSPTGYMHVGNLRTALYAYLAAKAGETPGTFILRVEDTDQERFVEGAMDVIYATLRETGLVWDEGPDVGGPVGPYVQSERREIYKQYAEQLIAQGDAYYCFCDKERLDEMKTLQRASGIAPRYDRHCLSLTPEEIAAKLAAGIPHIVRQRIPDHGTVTFHDEIREDITVECCTLDDQVLIKADEMPTYNFANVVDDHLMGVTTVIRGTEYLSSAPKYNLLYQAFGWEIPRYLHCPPVMKDATQKLSKRNGDASYQDLIAKGYLKDAILNYIALLGWSPRGGEEILSLSEMARVFSIYDVSKSPAVFDPIKLNFVNAEYLRRMTPAQFYETALPWIKQAVKGDHFNLRLLAEALHPRCEVLSDIPGQLDFLDVLPDYDLALFVSKKMKTDFAVALNSLQEIQPILENVMEFTAPVIHEALFSLIETLGCKNGIVLWPLRVALSGKQFTPGGGIELAAILGKTESMRRLGMAIERLSAC
ncbi:MAG: glutamate--tRNA ligase [Oscillospiraceae bacterium]